MPLVALNAESRLLEPKALDRSRCRVPVRLSVLVATILFMIVSAVRAEENARITRFSDQIQPILIDHCYRCHADGTSKGKVAFDQFSSDAALLANRDLWWAVLKNIRARVMPPADKPALSSDQIKLISTWIKIDVLALNPQDPDPGRVTIRRLNRVEYRNTIRDLMGIDFKAEEEFPPDDTGYGFDTIGDVLTVSPLLLEKYLQAAETIVATAVPMAPISMPERKFRGVDFRNVEGKGTGDRIALSERAAVARDVHANHPGDYQLAFELISMAQPEVDAVRGWVIFKLDGCELARESLAMKPFQTYRRELTAQLTQGDHRLAFEVQPELPDLPPFVFAFEPEPLSATGPTSNGDTKGANSVGSRSKDGLKGEPPLKLASAPREKLKSPELRLVWLRVQGPADPVHWDRTPNYDRFFPRPEPPAADADHARRVYARELLGRFAARAFRRPVADSVLSRLVLIAENVYRSPGKRFEDGIARAMVAVLASPRFLFRVEDVTPAAKMGAHPLVDEYALASRLSYFIWSTMPDEKLMSLASRGKLRENFMEQARRMLSDPRSEALTRNFVGQWLEVRDVEGMYINEKAVLRREGVGTKGIQNSILGRELTRAMRRETEMLFTHILNENCDVIELLDSDYTFLNARLAKHYGIPDIIGSEMRRVSLPKNSARGGVLTQASTLIVTSNPSRTSPVKRGKFILENILGTPPPPPPAEVPALEDAKKEFKDREPSTREMMALHRSKAVCSSCHSRMDPLGLALENFNALGMWRDKEFGQTLDSSSRLITGEPFRDIRELKRVLRDNHRADFYRCLTEKLLTYALGRGLESSDVEAVDQIVDRLEHEGGRSSALIIGVVESAPFQKRRAVSAAASDTIKPSYSPAQARSKP